MRINIQVLVLYLVLQANICFGNINYPFIRKNTVPNSLALCIEAIADINFSQAVIVLNPNNKNAKDDFVNNLIDNMAIMNTPLLITEILDFKKSLKIHRENPLVVIYLENCEAVTNFDTNIIEMNVKYLIAILKNCKNSLSEIRDAVAVLDVTFILIGEINEHELLTFIPHIDKKTCEIKSDIEPVHLDVCNNGLVDRRELFPMKNPAGLNGCPLKVGLALLFPFASIAKFENYTGLKPLHNVTGSDIPMFNIMADHLNAKLEFYRIERRKIEYEQLLYNGTLDICGGGLARVPAVEDIVEYSGHYYSQGVIWIYSARRTPMAWERIKSRIGVLFPFFIIYICHCFVFILFNYFDDRAMNISNTFLYSWGILFGTVSIAEPSSLKHRILVLFYLQSCLYVSLFIYAQVFTYLTIQLPPKTYESDEDMLASGKNCYIRSIWNVTSQSPEFQRFMKNCFKCGSSDDCVQKVLLHDGVALSSDGIFPSFQVSTAENNEATLLQVTENLFTSHNDLVIRKDSHLVKRIQRLMRTLYETGIIGRLITNETGLGIKEKAMLFSKNLRMNNYSCIMGCRVKLSTLAPLFYIWMFGCLLSCFSFAIEVTSKRYYTK